MWSEGTLPLTWKDSVEWDSLFKTVVILEYAKLSNKGQGSNATIGKQWFDPGIPRHLRRTKIMGIFSLLWNVLSFNFQHFYYKEINTWENVEDFVNVFTLNFSNGSLLRFLFCEQHTV